MSKEALRTETSAALIESAMHEAVASHQGGQLERAEMLYRSILAKAPNHFDATHLLGVIELQRGHLSDARNLIELALRMQPDHIAALNNLSTTLLHAGDLDGALVAAERADRLAPSTFDVLANLGAILHRMHRVREALVPLREAYRLNPNSAQVSNLLGVCLLKTENARAAAEVYESATQIYPHLVDVWANLSVALNSLGQHEAAAEAARKALTIDPSAINAFGALASAQFEMGHLNEAVETYRAAIAISPTPTLLCAFANALITSGMHAEALVSIDQVLKIESDNIVARWLQVVSQIMPVLNDSAQMEQSRRSFAESLSRLSEWYDKTNPPESFRVVGVTPPFYLAYYPFNNRDLLKRYGDVCVEWMRSLPLAAKSGHMASARARKIRIGFASTHIRNHSVWIAVAKGWVQNIDPKRFEIYLFNLGLQSDSETLSARRIAHHFEDQATEVVGWTNAIQRADLDVLIYPSIGMDAFSSQLAAMRLAPTQAVSWGHPETSGFSTVDYYLSGDLLEPENAQSNYTECLVRLPNLGVAVEPLKPKAFEPNMEALGFLPDEPLLLCAGSPFKYLPLHDWVWIEIAKGLLASGRGKLVFFIGNRGAMYSNLISRLRRSFDQAGVDFEGTVRVIPHLDRGRFYGLMQRSTMMLDTLGFSGFNTALQAVECGLPVLAFEGEFMRGRLASCLMRRMDIPDLIAADFNDYINRAIELACDAGKRNKLAREIAKRRKILFGDLSPVRALESFLEQSAN